MMKTLLVEPCPTARAAWAESLVRCGCEVTSVACEEEAYESQLAHGYPLAVLGVDQMRDHGFWLCRRLRAVSDGTSPMIFALSEDWDAGRLAWLLEAGVDDCLTSPPDESWLATRLDVVRQRVGFRRLEHETESVVSALLGSSSWLAKAIPYGIFRSSVEERHFLQVNQALVDILGYDSADELLGTDLAKAVYHSAEDREAMIGRLSGPMAEEELHWRRKDGTPIIVRASGRIIRDSRGNPRELEGIVEDITAKRQAELQLRETRDELWAIYDGMTDGILVTENPAARVLRTNPAMCKITGYTEAELLDMAAAELCPASEQDEWAGRFATLSETGKPLASNVPILCKDGTVVYCDMATNRFEYQGRVCAASFFRDVTDRRHAEAVLAKSEARFRAVFEGAALGVIVGDRKGCLLECNATYADMLGYSQKDLVGRNVADLMHPDDLTDEQQQPLNTFLDSDQESLQAEKRLLDRDGRTVWCRVTLSFLPEPDDRRQHLVGVVENITDRKLAQQALRESEYMLRSLIENLPDWVMVVSPDWTIQYINRDFPNVPIKEAIGKSLLSYMSSEYHDHCKAVQQRMFATGQVQTVRLPNNRGTWWDARVVPFSMSHDGRPGFLLICTDITVQKAALEAVEQEQESLRRMLQLFERDRELVAFEIHDGFAQQLTGALLNFEAARQIRLDDPPRAEKNFNIGLRLLHESIAESRRLVRGLRPPVLDEFGIVPAIEHLIEDHHSVGGGRVDFIASAGTRRLAQPLESALFRIVQEILNNARKHSQSDRIRIKLWRESGQIRVEIRDWGVGFDPEKVGFDHFGLRGIRERARLLGGTSEIDAKPGQGTRIRVDLPMVQQVSDLDKD